LAAVIPTGADDSQRELSAEWRNLLFPSAGKQVSRLRRIVRFATNPAPLEMTMKVEYHDIMQTQ